MTGWDVASDAVKIGLPLLLGDGVTLFTLRITRRHTERTERRKRIQDALEFLATALARLHEANTSNLLFKRDEYFQPTAKTESWAKGKLESLDRMSRYGDELMERYSIVTVLGENFEEEITAFYNAYNNCTSAYAEPGNSDAEITALENQMSVTLRTLLTRIASRHAGL